jgi:hypothetical protein
MLRIDQLQTTIYPSLSHFFAAMKDGETVQLSIQQVLTLIRANLAETAPGTLDTIDEIAAALQDNPDAITEILNEQALRLKRDGSNFADASEKATFRSAAGLDYADLPWLSKPIGEPFPILTNVTGVNAPPTGSSDYRYVQLTAGLTGVAAYNEGCVGSESTTGSAPLVQSTATITLAGSPMVGQTIRMINTEGRFLRASTASGAVENDQMQTITGSVTGGYNRGLWSAPSGAFSGVTLETSGYDTAGAAISLYGGFSLNSANSPDARTGLETRSKNLQATYFMRIK